MTHENQPTSDPSWFEKPSNIRMMIIGLVVVCILLFLAEFTYENHHAHFPKYENIKGFQALFGFVAVGTADRGMWFLLATLMISSLLNIAYLVPVPILGFMTPKGEQPQAFKEAPLMCVVPLCITAVGSVLLFFFADQIYDVLVPITESAKIVTEVKQ